MNSKLNFLLKYDFIYQRLFMFYKVERFRNNKTKTEQKNFKLL